jgi:hypothetical protein
MNEELPIISIKPNQVINLPILEEGYVTLLKETDAEDLVCRAAIQDETYHGIILPAKLVNDCTEISFILPEQLCIFNPNITYTLKLEVILETQLLTPVFGPCRIDLEDLEGTEEVQDDEEGAEELQASEKAYNAFEDNQDDIDAALDLIAPVPVMEQKKTKLEDLAKGLDEEFVKHALFQRPEKQQAPTPVRISEPAVSSLTPEQLAVKQRMKALLRNMLG